MNDVQNETDHHRPTPDHPDAPVRMWKLSLYRDLARGQEWSQILQALAQVFGVNGVWLTRGNQRSWGVRLGSYWASSLADSLSESALSVLETQVAKWLVDGNPLVIEDLAFDARVAPLPQMECGIRSLIAVPLEIQGKRAGVLYLADAQPYTLNPSLLCELEEVAATLAHRVASEAMTQQLQQQKSVHQAVAEITRVMASELDLQPTLQFIVDLTRRVTGRPACWVALPGEENGAESLDIAATQGIDPADVRRLLSHTGSWTALDVRHVRVEHAHFKLLTLLPVALGGAPLGTLGIASDDNVPIDESACRALNTLCRLAALAIHKARMSKQLDTMVMETVQALVAALEARDPLISAHSQRVSYYLGRLAEHLGTEPSELKKLVLAGLLHDIGKIALPVHLLTHQEPLSPAEWDVVRQHALIGAQIISGVQVLQPIVPIIRHQYERYDGSGSPSGLRGLAIPQGSRALAVVDTFDTLMSRQPHRPGLPLHRALATLKEEAGTKLDPHLVAAFLEIAPAAASNFLPSYEAPPVLPSSDRAVSLFSTEHSLPKTGSSVTADDLTPRERQVLSLIGMGCSNKEIAARLFLSEKTVKTHVMHIFQKLGVRDRTRAALCAFSLGLVPPPDPEKAEA